MMRRMLYLFLIGCMLTSIDAFAGIYGGIKGRVLDEGGEPLVGANVYVIGTNLGAYTDAEGRYSVQKINPGRYDIKFSYAGYKEVIMPVDVELDVIKDLSDVKLGGSVADTIIVVEKMIQNKNIGSVSTTKTDDVRKLPVNGINSIVTLTSGVRGTGGGFSVRGARTSETQIRVDGIDVGNQFTGGFGLAGSGLFPMVSQYATEQVQVIKGGFSAEYGDVLGGVVNTTVKTGRTDRYEGFLVYNGQLDALWGRQKAGLKLIRESEGSRLKAIDYGEGYKLIGNEGIDFEGGFGGPLPFLDKSSFYISGTYKFDKYGSGYDIKDPWGNSITHLPNDNTWVKNLTARVRFALTDDINFIVGGTFGMTNFEQMGWGWLYCDDEGVIEYNVRDDNSIEILKTNGIPEYEAKIPVGNQNNSSIMVRMNHTLNQNSYYEITMSRNTNDDEYGRRIGTDDPGFFSGFDYWYPVDQKRIQGYNLMPGQDKIIDPYTYLSRVGKTKDKYFLIDMGFINPETGYIEGDVDGNGGDNPYGMLGAFVVHGNSGFQFRNGTYWQIDGNYNLLIPYKDKSKDFDHAIRAGFEIRFYETTKHSNSNPWDSDPFYDLFTDQWGGNLYISDSKAYNRTSKGFFPIRASAYVQDQITYKGIIFSPGIRVDMFDPKSIYRVNADQAFSGIDADTGFADAGAKFQVSPRINIAYPISERSFLSIAYGIYFKMPEIQYLYDGFNKVKLRPGAELLGEPNMEAQRTNQYQIAYNHQLSDMFAFDITAYYRDIYNQLGTKYVAITPYPYYQYVIAEYGNAKGIEFQLRKRENLPGGDPISFRIDYTLGYITGTSANVASNYGKPIDPYTNEMTFQMTEYFQPQDIRHTLNASITYSVDRRGGPAIGDVYPLEMSYITLSGFFHSGTPYTPQDISGNSIAELNSARQPSAYNLSLRFSKSFLLRDFFGESIGNTRLEFFFNVYNLLNLNDAIAFYPRTNDPIDNGSAFDYRIGYFSSVPLYRDPNYLIAETLSPDQYNRYGDRLYGPDADIDNNGIVTQDEKLKSYERQLETSMSGRGNFQTPRTVVFGIMVNF